VENVVEEALKSTSNSWDNPKYDFNSDVYKKVQVALCLDKLTSNNMDISQNLKDGLENIIRRYKPELRSLVQFVQDMRIEDFPDIETQIESPANEDDGQGGYTVQGPRRANRRKFQKYSQECRYSFRCTNGFKCGYSHTDKRKRILQDSDRLEITVNLQIPSL